MNIIYALLQWTLLFVVRVVTLAIGLFAVAFALPYCTTQYSIKYTTREILNLPKWMWLFGNDFDGALGDRRGWWAENADKEVLFGLIPFIRTNLCWGWLPKLKAESFLAKWWWMAIRNPVNNMRLVPGFKCPVDECQISYVGSEYVTDKPGNRGWQFVTAKRVNGKSRWYGFYAVYAWSETRAFVVRTGYKVEPRHQGTVEHKGFTFRFNPLKKI